MTAVSAYLKKITQAFSAGNATEHTHRPALKELIEILSDGVVATNEPRRVQCGAPDFIVTKGQSPLGYVECKDIGKPLAEVERTEQLKRYRESLGNLILTNYLEFRWYVGGEYRMTVQLATIADSKIKPAKNATAELSELFNAFFTVSIPTVNSPKELALRMAGQARLIRDIIQTAFNEEDLTDDEPDQLHEQLEGFRKILIHDLQPDQFADMYAQTICYGLFAARCNSPSAERFTRQTAGFALPKTNPFLRKMFDYIAGINLDDRIVWAVDDLAELLHHTDMEAILRNFGKRTRQEDPVVHFYESFLAAYDPRMRQARGVYYTPEPVVSYIVRSIDHILKKDFKLKDGLADASTIKIDNPAGKKKKMDVHKVQILDPATGTGTFLYSVIDHINERFKTDQGMWSSYVSQHLLPRIFGFELLMAPYAVAHMKLGLQLRELGYDFQSSERLRIYLTNTLEEAHAMSGLPLFTQWIAEEANAASDIKKDAPVMVVLGNPPYSGHSANTGKWISGLLRGIDSQTGEKTGNYFEVDGQPLGERNPKWLNDDYVKFIRFAQWRIEQTGYGVLAFISNNGYLDNPTFRGMRQQLMKSFSDIYILNLHGDSRKKEIVPNNLTDENVFDIQQGVTITIFVKSPKPSEASKINYFDLWGSRAYKYEYLLREDIKTSNWQLLEPSLPFYLFVPQDADLSNEYGKYWRVTDAFPNNSVNLRTHRDRLVIDFDREQLEQRIRTIINSEITDEWLRQNYGLQDNRDWSLVQARIELKKLSDWNEKIRLCHYRPFDFRWIFYDNSLVEYPCYPVVGHFRYSNIGFTTTRQTTTLGFEHILATRLVTELKCVSHDRGSYSFPLFLYPIGEAAKQKSLLDVSPWPGDTANSGRVPNLSPNFVAEVEQKLSLTFTPNTAGDLQTTFGPDNIFHYTYAILHSPTYRTRYAEFLKRDFPRLPLTSNQELFRDLCNTGDELVALHLMESHGPKITTYPVAGDSSVETVRYTEPQSDSKGRVWINKTQYFEGVPRDVWEFHIGGYQVCEKWLKDRKGRQLTYDDLTHYQHIVSALSETIRLMQEIDEVIEKHGGWPIQ